MKKLLILIKSLLKIFYCLMIVVSIQGGVIVKFNNGNKIIISVLGGFSAMILF